MLLVGSRHVDSIIFVLTIYYNKIVKSVWLSTVPFNCPLMSALIEQCNKTVSFIPK